MYQRQPEYEQDLVLANDPNTASDTLRVLLAKHHGEREMAETIARNPACDYLLFLQFWKFLPEIAATNPALSEYQAQEHWQDQSSVQPRLSYSKWSGEISAAKPEIHKAEYIMQHGNGAYQRYIMSLGPIPEYLIRDYLESKSAPLRKVIAGRTDLPADIQEKLAADSAKTVRKVLAENASATGSALATLAMDDDQEIAGLAQQHPNCPDDVIVQARTQASAAPGLADTAIEALNFAQLAALASDVDTPEDKLMALGQHDDPCIRFLAGIHAHAPAALLTGLAEDQLKWVRAAPALNTRTPVSVIDKLLKQKISDIQVALASNSSLSEEQQLQLALVAGDRAAYELANMTQYDSVRERLVADLPTGKAGAKKTWRYYLREALAARKTGKFTSLQQGAKSRHLFVSRIAARAESCPDNLIVHYAYYCFEDYSQNPLAALALLEGKSHVKPIPYREWKIDKWLTEKAAPGFIARYYIRGDDPKRRAQAVSSWTTPLLDLLPFALDADTNTRKRLAERGDLIQFLYEMLARDEKSGVREQIAKNKKVPKSVLEQFSNDKATTVRTQTSMRLSGGDGPAVAQPLVNQGSATERARLAKKTDDKRILAELSGDRAASVRLSVAKNSYTESEILNRLAGDSEAKIRAVVAARMKDESIRRTMLMDEDKTVRIAAARNGRWYRRENNVRTCDAPFIELICHADDEELRAIAAEYTDNPALMKQYMSDSETVTIGLARNGNLTEELKIEFAKRCDSQIALAALVRNTESEQLFLIVADKISSRKADDPIRCHGEMLSRPAVQDRLCTHILTSVRLALARQKVLTDHARATLSQDNDKWVRAELR